MPLERCSAGSALISISLVEIDSFFRASRSDWSEGSGALQRQELHQHATRRVSDA